MPISMDQCFQRLSVSFCRSSPDFEGVPMSIMSVLAETEPQIDWDESQEGPEFEAQLAAFEARIARGEKIEPTDWMPLEYRRQLIRMISQHAHSENWGCLPEGAWIPNAPSFT